MSTSPYLTPKEAAAYCRLHYHTFIARAKASGLKADGMSGQRRLYLPATLDRWLKNQQRRVEAGAL